MGQDLAAAIFAAEQRRCAAMVANDSAALDAILNAQLHFAHANGGVDDKAAYLAKMAGGRIVYKAINWSEQQVVDLGNGVAMLTGRMATDVEVEGVAKALRNRVISIWTRAEDDWRVMAFQSTPLAD